MAILPYNFKRMEYDYDNFIKIDVFSHVLMSYPWRILPKEDFQVESFPFDFRSEAPNFRPFSLA